MKQCTKCKQWKDNACFSIKREAKDGLSTICKDCIKLYYETNKKKIKEQARQNYYKNHDKYLAYDKQRNRTQERILYRKNYNDKYRKEHKEQLLKYDRQRSQKRWKNIDYKLDKCISSGIYHALKENKAERHWEDLVSYSLAELKEHLEKQFDSNMNWDNYGEYWEIDHIIPRNQFNYFKSEDREFQICWSLANFRPLTITENRSRPKDGSDISEELKQFILGQNI